MRRALLLTTAAVVLAACTSTLTPEFGAVLTVEKVGIGTIQSEPPGIACGSNDTVCAFEFSAGETVRLLVFTSLAGVRVGAWSDGSCAGSECEIQLDGPATVRHVFMQRLLVIPSSGIAAVSTPCGSISHPVTCDTWLLADTSVVLSISDTNKAWWKDSDCPDVWAATCPLDMTRPRYAPVKGALRGQALWLLHWGTPGNDQGTDVDLFQGDVFVAGSASTNLVLGAFSGRGRRDALLGRVRAGNGTLLSARAGGGTLEDAARGVAASDDGAFYAGNFESDPAEFGDPAWDLHPIGGQSGFAAGYDFGGQLLWTTAGFHGPGSVRSVDARDGKVVLAGFDTTVDIDAIVSMHDAATGARIWERRIADDAGNEQANDVIFDAAGDVYVAGQLDAEVIFKAEDTVDNTEFTITSSGLFDGFLAKLRGSDGRVLWARSIGGANQEDTSSVALGRGGTVFVSGSFESSFVIGSVTVAHSAGTTFDAWVVSFDGTGKERFGWGIGHPTGRTTVNELAIDPLGPAELAVAGVYDGVLDLPGSSYDIGDSGTGDDGFVALLTTDGLGTVWAFAFTEGVSNQGVRGVAYSATSGLFATGLFDVHLPLTGLSSPFSVGQDDGFLLRFVP